MELPNASVQKFASCKTWGCLKNGCMFDDTGVARQFVHPLTVHSTDCNKNVAEKGHVNEPSVVFKL